MSLFVTFEGTEGSGKTTQIRLLSETLSKQGDAFVLTHEPGATALGSLLRPILLRSSGVSIPPLSELLLYAADRAAHCEEVILPALKKQKIVLCDRFIDSTTAYQQGGHGLDRALVQTLNQIASFGLKPDLTFWIDCPIEEGLRRAKKRIALTVDSEDRFENMQLDFHKRVRATYLEIAKQEPSRFLRIEGQASIEEIHDAIVQKIKERLMRLKQV